MQDVRRTRKIFSGVLRRCRGFLPMMPMTGFPSRRTTSRLMGSSTTPIASGTSLLLIWLAPMSSAWNQALRAFRRRFRPISGLFTHHCSPWTILKTSRPGSIWHSQSFVRSSTNRPSRELFSSSSFATNGRNVFARRRWRRGRKLDIVDSGPGFTRN
ncbi:hypothetical protein DFH06DRAFT_300921 [Mycena polygramma]|nr:hypothetical protein DFH06DRAFT_300921 [Mycena polygramma]